MAETRKDEDLRPAVSGQPLLQSLDAEPGIHGVRQSPGQNLACRPARDRGEGCEDETAVPLIGGLALAVAAALPLTAALFVLAPAVFPLSDV